VTHGAAVSHESSGGLTMLEAEAEDFGLLGLIFSESKSKLRSTVRLVGPF
jgi:hypothetical protein